MQERGLTMVLITRTDVKKIQDRALVNPQKGLIYSKTSETCLNLTCVTVYILSLYYKKQDQLETKVNSIGF